LVGTDTGKEKRTHGYEQNSIFGSRNEWVTIAEFASLWFRLLFKSFPEQHTVLCRDLPSGGARCPFIRRGANAQCSLRAERIETKGRKTDVQTMYPVDTTTVGARADCDVLCAVACAG